MADIGQRLEQARIAAGLTKARLSQLAKVKKDTFYRLLNGDVGDIAYRTVQALAGALGLTMGQLLADETSAASPLVPQLVTLHGKIDEVLSRLEKRQMEVVPASDAPYARVYGRAAAGLGEQSEPLTEEPPEVVPLPPSIAALPGRKIALRVSGDSMTPYLRDGDLLVAWYGEKQLVRQHVLPGDIMVITDGSNDEYVKSVYWNDEAERLTLSSLNPDYPEKRLSYDNIRWTGLVVAWSQGMT